MYGTSTGQEPDYRYDWIKTTCVLYLVVFIYKAHNNFTNNKKVEGTGTPGTSK